MSQRLRLVRVGDQQRIASPSVLEAGNTRTVSAIEKFVVKDHFKIGTIMGVKIAHVGDNFKKVFGAKVETGIASAVLRSYKLLVRSPRRIIRIDLGDDHTSYLGHIWKLMAAQPNGEQGALLSNSYANNFFVQDDDGKFWAVEVRCINGWRISAYSVDSPCELDAGDQVFGG